MVSSMSTWEEEGEKISNLVNEMNHLYEHSLSPRVLTRKAEQCMQQLENQ